VATDFLAFSTPELRERACAHEVTLNRRLAPDSYLGVGHFSGPADCPAEPVIVMRRYADSTRLTSMVTDGRPVHEIPITAVFEFAHRFGLGVIAVYAWSKRRPAGDVTLPFMIDWNQVENDERQCFLDRLVPWIELYAGVAVTEVVDPDKPSRALLRCATDAQLIVVGSRGRRMLAGDLLGSTGLNLLHHSAIPVMNCRSSDTGDRSTNHQKRKSRWINHTTSCSESPPTTTRPPTSMTLREASSTKWRSWSR
jgi:hypothetical protein